MNKELNNFKGKGISGDLKTDIKTCKILAIKNGKYLILVSLIILIIWVCTDNPPNDKIAVIKIVL